MFKLFEDYSQSMKNRLNLELNEMFEHFYYEKESQPVSHSHLQQQLICNGF